MKTVKTASKKLPEDVRAAFLRAFKATKAMDIYDGVLNNYMLVIAMRLEDKMKEVISLEKRIDVAKEMLSDLRKKI